MLLQTVSEISTFNARREVGQDRRNGTHFGDRVEFDVMRVGVGKDYGKRECADNGVAELDTTGRNDIAKTKVVFAEKLGEVVEENKKQAKCASVEVPSGNLKVCFLEEWCQELEQRQEKLVKREPAFSILRQEQLRHEVPVGN